MKIFKKFFYTIVLVLFSFGFTSTSFGLELGVGYPPMQNQKEVQSSVNKINQLGTRDVRITDSWKYREPQKDVYNWEPLDYRIDSFYNNKTRIFLTFDEGWPEWTNSTGAHLEQETLDEFREYISLLLQRYGDKIYGIAYGNEWNWSLDEKFNGSVDGYVAYQNIVYEEVLKIRKGNTPYVVLGSYSGLAYIAYDAGLISDYKMMGVDVDQMEFRRYASLPQEQREINRVEEVLKKAKYEVLNIHLYDTYYQWAAYTKAFQDINIKVKGKKMPIVVGEFGGPYPQHHYNKFGRPSQYLIASSFTNQLLTMVEIPDIEIAYYFKLTETEDKTMAHPDNYLFYLDDRRTQSFYVFKEAIQILKNYKK